MKKLLQLKTMLLLCALIAGVGSAWGDETTYSAATGPSFTGGSNFTISTGGSGTASAYNDSEKGVRLYASNTLTITPQNGETITSINMSVACNTGGKNKVYPTGISANSGTITAGATPGAGVTSVSWSGSTSSALTFTVSGAAGNVSVKTITIAYTPAAPAYTITAQSNNNTYGTVSLSGTVITGSPNSGYRYATPAYTVTTGTATVSQSGNAFTVTPSSDCTVTINFEAIPTHTAHFSVNGTIDNDDDDTVSEGSDITFPSDPSDINGKTFVGWVTIPIVGTTDVEPSFITSATMSTNDITYYAVFATAEDAGEQAANKTITQNTTNFPTSYAAAKTYSLDGANFNILQGYKNGEKMQWRAAGNSNGTGTIYNETGLNKIQSVVITYHSDDDKKNFTLKIGDSANPTGGTSITPTNSNLVYTFDCSSYNKSYFVLTNGENAGYLTSIVINYLASGGITYSAYATTVSSLPVPTITFKNSEDEAITSLDITAQDMEEVSVECSAGAVTISVTSDDDTIAEYDEGYVMGYKYGTATLTATFAGNESYQGTSATLTVNVAKKTTTTTVAIDIDDKDVYTATEGGLATATVKAGGSTVTPVAVTWTSSDTSVATIDEDGEITLVGAGTTTITASYAGTDVYAPSEGTYELTLTSSKPQSTSVDITLNNTFFGCTAFTSYAAGSATSYSGKEENVTVTYAKGTGSGFYCNASGLRLYSGGSLTFTAPTGYLITKIVLTGQDGFESGLTNPDASATWTGGSASVVIAGETKSGSDRKNMTGATVTLAPAVTITAAKYATYCSPHKLDFSATGITVYKAKVNGSVVKMTEISNGIVPANTGVILYKDVDADTTIAVPVTTTDATITDNELVGTTVRTLVAKQSGDKFNYILQNGQDGIVFNMATESGAYMPANRAYLSTAYKAPAGSRLSVVFEDEQTTGIHTVNSGKSAMNGVFYDLQGRRVENPRKGGLYIVNGRKVVKN